MKDVQTLESSQTDAALSAMVDHLAFHKPPDVKQTTLLGAFVAQLQCKQKLSSLHKSQLLVTTKLEVNEEPPKRSATNIVSPDQTTTIVDNDDNSSFTLKNKNNNANQRTLDLLEQAIAATVSLKELPNHRPSPPSPKRTQQTWKRPVCLTRNNNNNKRIMRQPIIGLPKINKSKHHGRVLMRTAPLLRRDNHCYRRPAKRRRSIPPTTTTSATTTTHTLQAVPSQQDVGVPVKTFFGDPHGWFDGTIVRFVHNDNTAFSWTVQYSDGEQRIFSSRDELQTQINNAHAAAQPTTNVSSYDIGQAVYKYFTGYGWYSGTIVSKSKVGYFVEFEDGDREEFFFGDLELDTIVQQAARRAGSSSSS